MLCFDGMASTKPARKRGLVEGPKGGCVIYFAACFAITKLAILL